MTAAELEARQRILEAAIELLSEEPDAGKITVRRIAERAGVGIGAINYHFQTKDNLLNEAVSSLMMTEAEHWLQPPAETPDDPEERLRALLKQTSLIGVRYPHLLEISVRYELEHGQFSVAALVVPLMREIAAGGTPEADIRLAAAQLIASTQVIFLRRAEVARFAGLNIADPAQVEAIIDRLVDNIVNGIKG
jgi:AcrR family transcriptional regulator